MTDVLFFVSKSLIIDLKCVSFIVVRGAMPLYPFSICISTSAYSANLSLNRDFCPAFFKGLAVFLAGLAEKGK